MATEETTYDDLTKISGIGGVRQRWLDETFGARTYADVAALYADEIEAQLKAEGKPYSRSEIELWPEEAAALAAEKSRAAMHATANPSNPNPGSNPKKTKAQKGTDEPWKPVATFIVEFQARRTGDRAIEYQTKISHHDTDKEKEWPGIESEGLGAWMVEHAGDKLCAEAPAAPVAEAEAKATPPAKAVPSERLSVIITGLRLFQPAGTEVMLASGKNGRPHGGYIQAGDPFVIEASFELGEQAAALGKREIPYRAQFYTQNRTTGEKAHLGQAEPGLFSAARATYSARLAGITLPAGSFRLQVVVLAEEENVAPAYFELSMLRAQ